MIILLTFLSFSDYVPQFFAVDTVKSPTAAGSFL